MWDAGRHWAQGTLAEAACRGLGEGQSRAFRVRTRTSGRIWGLPGATMWVDGCRRRGWQPLWSTPIPLGQPSHVSPMTPASVRSLMPGPRASGRVGGTKERPCGQVPVLTPAEAPPAAP